MDSNEASTKQSEENHLFFKVIFLVIIIFLWGMSIALLLQYSREKKACVSTVEMLNNVNFDALKANNGVLPDGTKLKVEPSIKYPADVIVYYRSYRVSVENDNGLAKVVAVFDDSGNEVSIP